MRDFVKWCAEELGLTIEFSGEGIDEIGTVTHVTGNNAPAISIGDIIVRVDSRYFRPAEVETLLGDPTNAKEKLGWQPKITAQEMCSEMVRQDLKIAKQTRLLKDHGYNPSVSMEE